MKNFVIQVYMLLNVDIFSCNLCATALRNKFQQVLHCVTWSVVRQVSRKGEPLSSTSATACNGRIGEKTS